MSAFKNVLVLGPSGSLGSIIVQALDQEPSFNVTLLKRASSKAKLPSHLKTITISDTYPQEDLISAFRGQDVVLDCLTAPIEVDRYRLVDAAVAAGVRRFVPSEYGLNNERPDARELTPMFREKAELREYLRAKAATGAIEWTGFACGTWLKWDIAHEFLGVHVAERRFVFWDDGEGLFSCTTEENTAAGVVQALKNPDATRNRDVFLSDFSISQKQLLESLERIHGVKYATETVDSKAYIKERQAAEAAGDKIAVYNLVEVAIATGQYGIHFEKEGEVWNERLGLPKQTLDGVIEEGLKLFGAI